MEMTKTKQAWAQRLLQGLLRRELGKLPREAQAALSRMQVTVVRRHDRVEIVVDAEEDARVEKAMSILLDACLAPVAQLATAFGCRVKVEMDTAPRPKVSK